MVFNDDFSLEPCKAELQPPGVTAALFYQLVKHRALGEGRGGDTWEKLRAWELLLPGEKALPSLSSKRQGHVGPAHSTLLHRLGVSP